MSIRDLSTFGDDTDNLRSVLDLIDLPAAACDLEGRLVYVNDAALQLWGSPPDPTIRWCRGLNMLRGGRPTDESNCLFAQAIRESRAVHDDSVEIRHPSGTLQRVSVRAVPIRQKHGIVGAVAIVRDSFDRKTLEVTRGRLTAIVQSSDDAIISTDLDGVITSWNEGASRLYGYDPDEAIGRPISILVPPDRADEEPAVLARVRRGDIVDHYETYRCRKDGEQVAVSLSVSPMRDESGVIIGASKIARDVSERYAADLVHSRLAAIVESSDDAIVSKDLNGTITSWNRGAERLFGYTASEAIGRPITILIPQDRLDEEPQVLGRIVRGESIDHFETLRRTKNGALLDISLTVSPIRDRRGKIVGASKIARDVTERKRTERQLLLADKRKDEFLATLSHELRNPLAPLRTTIEILKAQHTGPESSRRMIDIMLRQVDHLVRLVDDLLEVSRISRGTIRLEQAPLALDDALRDAIEFSKRLIELRGHRFTVNIPAGPFAMTGDRVRLVQVFSNLLNNAAKFTPKGGSISIDLHANDREAVVQITDSGVGIPGDELENIFGLFSQLPQKESSGGLGVGLSLARQLLTMHGGTVYASSEGEGRGATFVVRLPLNPQIVVAAATASTGSPRAHDAPRRILVVDDNRDAADSLAALLDVLGHDVGKAYGGESALQLGDKLRPEIAVIDIGMPGLSGHEVAQRIRTRDWGKQAVLIALTGWGQEGDRARAREAGFDHHVVKPVQARLLQDLLRDPARPKREAGPSAE